MQEVLEAMRGVSSKSQLLKDYCPWLANFSANKTNMELEIPGQYDGQKMPLPQYHVKIHKFHPEVLIMNSLRKPIKITILGNDTKEYSYLVKFGEDIRQDQRVEQLFVLMNEMFQKNSDYLRQVSLATFEVIPLTSSLGIIKWVDNTLKIQDFMKQAIRDKRVAKAFPDSLVEKYSKFIFSAARGIKTERDAYGKSAQNHDRNKIIGHYLSLVNDVQSDLLRKAFWNISISTESFIALRHNFMRSYATMCAAHWLLGIGDRHLGNTLISLEDGRVIGIDFGHAFGTATQSLGVPELIPFRLTPQIVSFMEPSKEKGHFRESMIHTLECLRESKRLLLATMSVFIKEPSLDWLEKPKTETLKEENQAQLDWYPTQKIDQSRRKLEGVNSTVIMIEDLETGVVGEYRDAYYDLVKGVREFDYRAQIAKEGLSVEEQVDCLIDHAGDYNLLGRTYCGWLSWI
ncbi:hypothetical protein HHI36_012146 [Cryptolaemus montrouzieri]|uniref:non-specific serine/threonine protein kinase n=1 Tax=Cryptolaemus montrouzieri TaxID=559131 RepID=A0ABD2NDW3_9CUCU